MRLLFKELKKLFNLRLSIILSVFTALYFCLILSASFLYLGTGQNDYYLSLHKELLSEFGGELSLDEWDAFLAKREEIAAEFADKLEEADSEILNKYDIKSYEDYLCEQDRLLSEQQLSEADAELYREISRMIEQNESTYKLLFQLQLMDHDYILKKEEYHSILSSENEFEAAFAEGPGGFAYENEAVLAREKELATRGSVSLVPYALISLPDNDFGHMLALAAIISFATVLPRPINERLRKMRPIQLVTKTGRWIFAVQARACALFGIAVGVFLSLAYGALLIGQGLFAFFACDINGVSWHTFGVDISYGCYMLIHAGVLILFSVCCSLAAYFIGRLAGSYIAGIGIALPVAAALVYGFIKLTGDLLSAYTLTSLSDSLTKYGGMLAILAAIALAVLIMLKRDKVRDIL
ncbi:MAG: hypothetical protein IKI64_00905 [Clostridia bacterium]|nr:hypothetical protein [Clostridia bacterium]